MGFDDFWNDEIGQKAGALETSWPINARVFSRGAAGRLDIQDLDSVQRYRDPRLAFATIDKINIWISRIVFVGPDELIEAIEPLPTAALSVPSFDGGVAWIGRKHYVCPIARGCAHPRSHARGRALGHMNDHRYDRTA